MSLALGLYNIYLVYTRDTSAMHSLNFNSVGMIITLISIGKYVKTRSKLYTNNSLRKLLSIAPDETTIIIDGVEHTVPISELAVRDIVLIRSGEKAPSDVTVVFKESLVNESMLIGKSILMDKSPEDTLYDATVNGFGSLKARIEKTWEDTVLLQIACMMEMAQRTKAPVADIADRVAAVFISMVIIIVVEVCLRWLTVGCDI